ncbi:MAG: peptidase M64 [Planctomycetes bacterium]|nr:peptidase M64 [Planctomycetota bacterium]
MRPLFLSAMFVVLAVCGTTVRADAAFDTHFTDTTLRLDYYHTGTAAEEHFAFDQIVQDGSWAGSTTNLIDDLRLGKYLFEVRDLASDALLYSRGFCSIYGEWETTAEAKAGWGVFHESLRLPWPRHNVKIVLYKRKDTDITFETIWEQVIKTGSWRAVQADVQNFYKTFEVLNHGDSTSKVDIVILGEGYTAGEMVKFRRDAQRFAQALNKTEPFASRKTDFNIRGVQTPSPSSGIHHPHQGSHARSALSVRGGAFDSQRYALGFDNKKIRDAASAVPYDFTVILMNDKIYGGGGIYQLYITAAADNAFSEYVFVHEFGHHFACLADEYYTSSVAYELPSVLTEPYELNVTIQTDRAKIKWGELIGEDTPLPTPWGKDAFDRHSRDIQKTRNALRQAKAPENLLEALFRDQLKWEEDHLANIPYAGKTGLYEGAMYQASGMYRSAPGCIMHIRTDYFCPACQRAINLVMDQYTQ